MDKPPATFSQLVGQHDAKRTPSLIEDRAIKPGFLPDLAARFFSRACCRRGHIAHLQRLHNDRAVVLGEVGAVLVEEILARVGNTLLDARHAANGFKPVTTAALLSGKHTLRAAKGAERLLAMVGGFYTFAGV